MFIETLKIFCDLVDLKSFSKAAEANYVTQSAVSQQIRGMEKTWKTTLIERSNREMALTREGEIVYQEAKMILEHYERMNRLLGKATQVVEGNVRVASILAVGLHELPPYVQQFIKRYPKVNVRLEYMHNDKVYEQVLSRRSDIGIVAFPVQKPHIEIVPFRDDRMVIVCHPKHPLAKYKKVRLSKIKGMKFVAFEKTIPTRKAIDGILKANNVQVNIVMEFNNMETIKRAIEIDAGISILPFVSVQNEIRNKTLKAVEVAEGPLMRPLGILLQKGRALPLSVSKFLDVLQES